MTKQEIVTACEKTAAKIYKACEKRDPDNTQFFDAIGYHASGTSEEMGELDYYVEKDDASMTYLEATLKNLKEALQFVKLANKIGELTSQAQSAAVFG